MTDTIFGNSTPTDQDQSDAAPGIMMGTRIRVNAAGTIDAVRWRCTNTRPAADIQWFLNRYNPADDSTAGALIDGETVDRLTLTTGAYNVFALTGGPLIVAPGDEFVASVFTNKEYVATPAFFASDVVSAVSGSLTGPADHPGAPLAHNGRFALFVAAPQWPTDGFNANGYHVDVVFTPAPPPVDAMLSAAGAAGQFQATAAAHADAHLAGSAAAGVFTASAHAAVAAHLGGVGAAGRLAIHASSGVSFVVPPPDTGVIARPSTGTIAIPRRVYP